MSICLKVIVLVISMHRQPFSRYNSNPARNRIIKETSPFTNYDLRIGPRKQTSTKIKPNLCVNHWSYVRINRYILTCQALDTCARHTEDMKSQRQSYINWSSHSWGKSSRIMVWEIGDWLTSDAALASLGCAVGRFCSFAELDNEAASVSANMRCEQRNRRVCPGIGLQAIFQGFFISCSMCVYTIVLDIMTMGLNDTWTSRGRTLNKTLLIIFDLI